MRGLPQVQRLLQLPDARRLAESFSHSAIVAAIRAVLDEARAGLRQVDSPAAPDPDTLLHRARAVLDASQAPLLARVINATGIILHTNLGRAPLPDAALTAISQAAGYCNLEYDLATGERGSRTQGIEPLLRDLTGAEAGLAVNNNAAAVLLALSALAGGGEVIVSRGELVEIGGGFRIPDVIQQGGARLVEVGTTNKTRLADYRAAISPATRVMLKVHQSNFRVVGFTQAAELSELVALARAHGLLVVHDLGSGAVTDLAPFGLPAEATVPQSVAAGAEVVAFSGDKLLGGPQAGLLAGRAEAVDRLRRHPLLRALRLDKLSLAALEATLRLHRDGMATAVPVLRMIAQGPVVLRQRAEHLAGLLGTGVVVQATSGFAGGGTLPGAAIPSMGICVPGPRPDILAAKLRRQRPPVAGRITEGRLLLDMLTVSDAELPDLARAVQAVLAG